MSVERLAKTLNCSERQVARYLKRGMPLAPREAASWLAENVVRRLPRAAAPDLQQATLADLQSLADAVEYRADVLERDVLPVAEGRAFWTRVIAIVEEEALKLSDIAAELAGMENRALIIAKVHSRLMSAWRAWHERVDAIAKAEGEELPPLRRRRRHPAEALEAARARVLAARARRRDILQGLRSRELIRKDDFVLVYGDAVVTATHGLRSIGSRLSGQIMSERSPERIAEMIEKEVRAAVAFGRERFNNKLESV